MCDDYVSAEKPIPQADRAHERLFFGALNLLPYNLKRSLKRRGLSLREVFDRLAAQHEGLRFRTFDKNVASRSREKPPDPLGTAHSTHSPRLEQSLPPPRAWILARVLTSELLATLVERLERGRTSC